MSAVQDFISFAERQCAVIENAAKAAAKRPRLEVVPGEIRYPAADIEAASDPVEFDRLLILAMQQVRHEGVAAAYLAPKLDEVREAYAALLDSETEALARQRLIGQGPLIRLEAAITDLQRWADKSADDQPTVNQQQATDDSGFVAAKQVDWQAKLNTTNHKKLRAFLKKAGNIRHRNPSSRRLDIHAGDWVRYWAAQDAEARAGGTPNQGEQEIAEEAARPRRGGKPDALAFDPALAQRAFAARGRK